MAAKKKRTGKEKSGGRKKLCGDSVFPRPLTSVDLAIFAVLDDSLCVLLVSRAEAEGEPFPDHPALPGGFVDVDRDADLISCARRKLVEKTGVQAPYLEQVGSWGSAKRDPRGWSTSHVYFALIPCVDPIELVDQSRWVSVNQVINECRMAFDHLSLLQAAVERLRSKVEYTSLPAYLLAAPFSLPQLQRAYEVILDRSLDKSSFRTRTLSAGYLQETGLMKVEAPRPAMGYSLKPDQSLVYFPRPLQGDGKK